MNSPIKWFGGKGSIAHWILQHFPPHDEYHTYVEPFGGGASVLFAKPQSEVEVYNDKDCLLVNFFKVLRNDFEEFKRQLDAMPFSRYEFHQAKEILNKMKADQISDPMEAAVQFFVLARQSFSGDVFAGWSVNIKNAATPGWIKAVERLPEIWNRFKHVHVENVDALDCINKYDSTKTLFYLDPPYIPSTRSNTTYRHELTWNQHNKLVKRLSQLNSMIVLSGYESRTYDTELVDKHGWGKVTMDVVNQSIGKTSKTKIQGEGSMKHTTKTEVVWWNPAVDKASRQLDMFSNIG